MGAHRAHSGAPHPLCFAPTCSTQTSPSHLPSQKAIKTPNCFILTPFFLQISPLACISAASFPAGSPLPCFETRILCWPGIALGAARKGSSTGTMPEFGVVLGLWAGPRWPSAVAQGQQGMDGSTQETCVVPGSRIWPQGARGWPQGARTHLQTLPGRLGMNPHPCATRVFFFLN